MKRLARALWFVALGIGTIDTGGCTSACIRHTDCGSGEQCITGVCIVVVIGGDGAAGAGSMTPSPSSTATTAPTSSSTPPPAGPDAGTTGSTDGGGIPPFNLDATFDGYTF